MTGDPVGHRERLFLVVCHVDERESHLLLQRLQLDLQGLAELGVQSPERLVQQEHAGFSTSARASATRCCWPPEQLEGPALLEPVSRTMASASPTRRFVSSFEVFWNRRPNATFSSTVRNGNRA
jgi:hypothetical protein